MHYDQGLDQWHHAPKLTRKKYKNTRDFKMVLAGKFPALSIQLCPEYFGHGNFTKMTGFNLKPKIIRLK
jgi:hypothetical protein